MSLQTFFDSFALLADAPNGVAKLRELILQLAVQGKLVSQDPRDEPASALFKKIKAEETRLFNDKQIREPKPLPAIEQDEKLYQLPNSWEWVRLGEVGQIVGGGTPSTENPEYFASNGIAWLTPADLYGLKTKFIGRGKKDISARGLEKSSAQLMPTGSVLFSSRAPIGYVAIAANPLATNQGFKSCVPFVGGMSEYIYYFLKSAAKRMDEAESGTTFKEVPGKQFRLVPVPLPPLEEQKCIVAKVDELMRLCDELEARQQARRESRARLNNATLAPLSNAASLTPKEFEQASARLADNFAALYDSAETVSRLRSTILQLAAQGKLVPQDSNDEPASELIVSIKKEKARLFEERGIIGDKLSFSIDENDIPFHLPDGWEWTRIANVITLKSGSTLAPDLELNEGQIPYLKVGDMNLAGNEHVITTSSRFVRRSPAIIKGIIPANSIIFPKRGGAIATNKKRLVRSEIVIDSNTMAMICHRPMPLEFLHLWFMTIDLWQLNSGTSVPQINNKDLEPLLMQVPPLAEQNGLSPKSINL